MSNICRFIFWDVQHGHATYIGTPNDRHIVVDLGTGDYSGGDREFSPLRTLKDEMNVSRLDYVVISHPHLDHIDDIMNFDDLAPKVLNRPKHIANSEVMEGVRDEDKDKFEKYCEINERYKHPIADDSINNTSNPSNWGGLKIRTFSPKGCSHENFNNQSIVSVFSFAKSKIVVPGDNEKESFEELMMKPGFQDSVKDADILLAPHHGRKSGFDKEFVQLVNPRLTIVSDGRFCDTSANSRYSDLSRGWEVHYRDGRDSEKRYCLTTNSDAEIEVLIGMNGNGNPFLSVKCG